ncbi:MAG: response regulator [Candidatus Omnitrophica bacterium]|nr:response regulator [Candidatus Omnitrophota bacterium]
MAEAEKYKGKKILVIDDEAEICDLFGGWLSYLGFEVLTARDGDDGLWKAKSQKPDLIITDAMMPGHTGYEIIERLRSQSDRMRDVPIIMMSGRPSMSDFQHLAFGFISKPFDPKAMLRLIEKALHLE